MPTFKEYLDSLEGKENLDALQIAKDLHSIYSEDIGIRDAKIDELNGTIAEKDGAITSAAQELSAQKAKNFDLAMQIPSVIPPVNDGQSSDDDVDESSLTIDDLFVK